MSWRNGPSGTLWNSARTDVKSCIWEGRVSCNDTGWGTALVRRTWWVTLDSKLSLSLQCAQGAQKANSIRGCINSRIASRLRKVIISLYSELIRWCLEYRAHFWGPQYKKSNDKLETSSVEGHQDSLGMQRLPCSENLGLLRLEMSWLWGDLTVPVQYL